MTKERRNRGWYGMIDKDGFVCRSWMKSQSFPDHVFDARPVIAVCNTWSELTPCNSGLREWAEGVKRGVWDKVVPVICCGMVGARPYWLGQNAAIIGAGGLSELYRRALVQHGLTANLVNVADMTLSGLGTAYPSLQGGPS